MDSNSLTDARLASLKQTASTDPVEVEIQI